MSDDPSSPPRGWLERISQALSGEPRTREELIAELHAAKNNGLLDAETLAMLEGAISVKDKLAMDVMVPRARMVAIPIDASLPQALKIVTESGHSRFPLYGESLDEIQGILLAKDLLKCFEKPELPCSISGLKRSVTLIPDTKRLNILLRDFRASRSHMAVVVDEYGGTAGLVTIEDVLEEIVGEIDDEHDAEDKAEHSIQQLDERCWSVQALTPIAAFNAHFGTRFSDDESDTIGGYVLHALGHLPEQGASIELDAWRFEVARADSRRVHLFKVQEPPQEAGWPEAAAS
jgi:magnesium and cobalt transporter